MLQQRINESNYMVIGILGMRGCGKTYLASHSLDFSQKVDTAFYLDVVGAFRKEVPDAVVIEVDTIPDYNSFREFLNKQTGKKLLLDISNLTRKDMVDITDMLCDYLRRDFAKTCALIVDEVGELIPQSMEFYSHGLESCARMGRNKGVLYLVLITQRPQKVNKHALSLSEQYAIFQFKHNLDIEAVRSILGADRKPFEKIELRLKKQKVGEFMLTDGVDVDWYERRGALHEGYNEEKGQDKSESEDNRRVAEARAEAGTDGLTKIEKIKRLGKKGVKPVEIAEIVGTTTRAVYSAQAKMRARAKKKKEKKEKKGGKK
jgi:hypothetical protein